MSKENKPFATDEECAERRAQLIKAGIITPGNPHDHSEDADFQPAPRLNRRVNESLIPEEGVYKCRPIQNDEQFERRRANYLYMLQSVLRTRRDLKLEFEEN